MIRMFETARYLVAVIMGLAAVLPATAVRAEGGHHGVESTLRVPDGGEIRHLALELDVDHSFPSDLTIQLRHQRDGAPSVTVDAISHPHDAAEMSAAIDLTEAFQGRDGGGEWVLVLADHGFGQAGELRGWTLRMERCAGDLCGDENYTSAESLPIPDLHFNVRSTEFWGAIVNFVLLVFLLVRFGRKPLKSFLVGRRRRVEEELLAARQMREEAQRTQRELTDRLEKLDREMEEIRGAMIKAGEEERDRIVAGAEKKAARLRKDARFMVEQQLKQLRVDLTREAATASVEAAERVLRDAITPDDQARLAKDYLDRLRMTAAKGSLS